MPYHYDSTTGGSGQQPPPQQPSYFEDESSSSSWIGQQQQQQQQLQYGGGGAYLPHPHPQDGDDEEDDDDEDEVSSGNRYAATAATPQEAATGGSEDESTSDDAAAAVVARPRKRPKSLAFAYLQGQATAAAGGHRLSHRAQDILRNLLQEQGFVHKESPEDAAAAVAIVPTRHETAAFEPSSAVVTPGMDDAQMVQRSKQGNDKRNKTPPSLAYLASFLAVLQDELGQHHMSGVPARVLIKRCCLAVAPSKVPAALDAEEMAMAALEFLASTTSNSNKNSLLPLIQAVKPDNDIKKRSYVKAGTWDLTDETLRLQLAKLEDVFLNDATSYKWLRRGVFAPANPQAQADPPRGQDDDDDDERDQLFRKGKHKRITSAPKRKATTAAASKRATAGTPTTTTAPSSMAMMMAMPPHSSSFMIPAVATGDEDDDDEDEFGDEPRASPHPF